MSAAASERDPTAAFAWVEDLTGATVRDAELQVRWRPHWFVDLVGADGSDTSVLLRGYRNPGYLGDETVTRAWLRSEAQVLRALQATTVKVPEYVGYHDELGWLCMERVRGDERLTDVDDVQRRHALFREYLDNLVTLHSLDPAALDLGDLPRPASDDDVLRGSLRVATMLYRAADPGDPEPLLELGLWWAEANTPAEPHGVALCGGDVGPNQFFFDTDGVVAMFDLELAHVGDPYEDLGLMRMREMCYPIGGLSEHYRYYAERADEPLDLDALQYWTMVGMLTGPMWCWARVQRPDAGLPDQIPIFSWDPIYRRGIAETLLEAYGIPRDPPERPAPLDTPRTRLHELLTGQLEDVYVPAATDPLLEFRLRGTAALAESLALGNELGPELDRQDLDELSDLLGYRPETLALGLATLEEQVRADPEHDLERRLRFLHRMQARRELVFEPVQRAMGFASNQPLTVMRAAPDTGGAINDVDGG